jgi:hypothetical protein
MKWTFLIIALLWSVPVAAQVEPTPEQKKLNREAYKSMAQKDHEAAIDAYLRSLERGELNVTWLNLGRAYQKSGQCQKAFEAYEHVPDAPQVAKPGPEVVASSLEKFLAELESECPTEIITRCTLADDEPDADVLVTLDGVDHPCGTTIDVEEGTHVITATGDSGRKRRSVYVARGQSVTVEFKELRPSLAEPATTDDTAYEPDSPWTVSGEVDRIGSEMPQTRASLDWGGVALISGGLVAGASGVVFDGVVLPGWPLHTRDFRLTAADFAPAALYTAGLTMVVLGIVDLLNGPERKR